MIRPPHQDYIATEMVVAAAISAVLSIVFLLLVFGHPTTIPMTGRGGLVIDAVPQSAVIALMSSLVPTLLTRRRVRAGAVAPIAAAKGAAGCRPPRSARWPRTTSDFRWRQHESKIFDTPVVALKAYCSTT